MTAKPLPCVGCKAPAHGSVGAGILCLEARITTLEAMLLEERARHRATREILAAFSGRHRHQAEES